MIAVTRPSASVRNSTATCSSRFTTSSCSRSGRTAPRRLWTWSGNGWSTRWSWTWTSGGRRAGRELVRGGARGPLTRRRLRLGAAPRAIDDVRARTLPFLRLADRLARRVANPNPRYGQARAGRRCHDIEMTTETEEAAAQAEAPRTHRRRRPPPPAILEAPIETTPIVSTPSLRARTTRPRLVAAMEASLNDFNDGDIMSGVVVKIDATRCSSTSATSPRAFPSKELSIRHDVDNEVVKVGDRIEALSSCRRRTRRAA